MSLRSIRRALNALLVTCAVLVAIAVAVDVLNLGPRSGNNLIGVTLVTQPMPFGTDPPRAQIQPVTTIRFAPRACASTSLMPFGGSLTAGANSYRRPIMNSMNQRQIPLDLVGSQRSLEPGGDRDHEGYAGYRIGPDSSVDKAGRPASLAAVVDSTIKLTKPDVVLILTGTDDLLDPEAAASLPSSLTALVTRIKLASPATLIIVAELPPTVSNPAGSPLTAAYNARAKLLADADAFDSVFFASTNAKLAKLKFDPAVDLTTDQTQFTPSGGRKFTIAIEPVIAGAIVRDRSRRCVVVPKRNTPTTRPTASVAPSTINPSTINPSTTNPSTIPQIDESNFIVDP